MLKLSNLISKTIIVCILLPIIVWIILVPATNLAQKKLVWPVHVYSHPQEGDALTVFVNSQQNNCEAVMFYLNAGKILTATGIYEPTLKQYIGHYNDIRSSSSNLFESTTLWGECQRNNDNNLETGIMQIRHYKVPQLTGSQTIRLESVDQRVQLVLLANSLQRERAIVIMNTNVPPAPPPTNIQFLGLSYSIQAIQQLPESPGEMNLRLGYPVNMLGTIDDQDLKVFRWSNHLGWLEITEATHFRKGGIIYTSISTKHFTTYMLGHSYNTIYLPFILK